MWNEGLSSPDFRATLSGRELMLESWNPGLVAHWGPVASLARTTISPPIADLSIIRDGTDAYELIVRGIVNADEAEFTEAVCRWAGSLGYARVWLANRLITLDSSTLARSPGLAEVRCRICRKTWRDDSTDFWLMSMRSGFFPLSCMCCGARLPQWSVTPAEDRKPTATSPLPMGGVRDGT